MSKTIAIDKVDLKIGDKTIPLTLDQARELKRVLENLFPDPITIDRPVPYPVPSPVIPWYPRRSWWDGPYWTSNVVDHPRGATLSLSCKAG